MKANGIGKRLEDISVAAGDLPCSLMCAYRRYKTPKHLCVDPKSENSKLPICNLIVLEALQYDI